MANRSILIGLLAGLAAGLMVTATVTTMPFAFFLPFVAAGVIYIATMGWGFQAGIASVLAGTGTIGGSGNYGFMVTATDSEINGGGDTDGLRIKIWDKNSGDGVVYDNQMGASDNADNTTALGGGSIKIHKAK